MMTDYEHEWRLGEWIFQPTVEEMNNIYAICVKESCKERLEKPDIESMLNEHAKLKREIEQLKKDMAPFQAQITQAKTYTVTPDLLSGGER